MRRILGITALTALALSATALTAQAQDKATELTGGLLGLASTSVDGVDGSVFQLNTGGAYAAVAFYLSPGMAIEPTITTMYTKYSGDFGDVSTSTLGVGVAVPYYFAKNWGRAGWYLAPRLGVTSYDVSDGDAVSQFDLGLALGYKVPLNDMAALRLQGSFGYGFENADVNSTTTFGGSLGLSVFLK